MDPHEMGLLHTPWNPIAQVIVTHQLRFICSLKTFEGDQVPATSRAQRHDTPSSPTNDLDR